jgi:hypothetical protein
VRRYNPARGGARYLFDPGVPRAWLRYQLGGEHVYELVPLYASRPNFGARGGGSAARGAAGGRRSCTSRPARSDSGAGGATAGPTSASGRRSLTACCADRGSSGAASAASPVSCHARRRSPTGCGTARPGAFVTRPTGSTERRPDSPSYGSSPACFGAAARACDDRLT